LVIVGCVVVIAASVLIYQAQAPDQDIPSQQQAAHVADSFPQHGQQLPRGPINVVIDTDLDITEVRSLDVKNQTRSVATAQATIDQTKLAVRRPLESNIPDGTYTVSYELCFDDMQCGTGQHSFTVDSSATQNYMDLRGKSEVTIDLKDIAFTPREILVSPQTTITWTNSDSVEHYVNTETHPYHTYFLAQNSRALSKGETFSTTFGEVGAYPYHCSAHAHIMRGTIVVQP
jgi:plastocyanin